MSLGVFCVDLCSFYSSFFCSLILNTLSRAYCRWGKWWWSATFVSLVLLQQRRSVVVCFFSPFSLLVDSLCFSCALLSVPNADKSPPPLPPPLLAHRRHSPRPPLPPPPPTPSCRSPVCGLPAESEDPHVKPGSHAARGQAHVLRVPPATASLRRHQSGVLP